MMERRELTFNEMPDTFEYKGHTYYKTFLSDGYRCRATGRDTFKYCYGPADDRIFLWVDGFLEIEEDLFDYDQFLK